ncbi:MAG: hypothetical protein OXM88_12860 [bacterium]|nr:hypothetical protein [bacterium]
MDQALEEMQFVMVLWDDLVATLSTRAPTSEELDIVRQIHNTVQDTVQDLNQWLGAL